MTCCGVRRSYIANLAKSYEENCDPLSFQTTCGMPCHADIDFVSVMTVADVVQVSLNIRVM